MSIVLTQQTTFATGIFDDGGSEIVAFDPGSQQAFVTNGAETAIDVLSFDAAGEFVRTQQIALESFGDGVTSVATANGVVAVAVEVEDADGNVTVPGRVLLFDSNGTLLNDVEVGVLPDMVTFTPDGQTILVANEGEPVDPADPEATDPPASISVIDISGGAESATVRSAGFTGFDGQEDALRSEGVRLFPERSVSEDVEPEYITTSADGSTAYVTLQEANALAVVDVANAQVTDILPLGTKDHSQDGHGFDPSSDDGAINIAPQPTKGLYMPDSIASYEANGQTYLVTANEGDSRDVDESSVADVTLDPEAFPNAAELQQDSNLGGLDISNIDGDTDGDGDFDELFTFGARSFSIWDGAGNLVFDSGDLLERITATANPANFNTDNDENDPDGRSDNKGPEPEAIEVGQVGDSTYAFVGLERVGGVVVYDVTDPESPSFVRYINTRDFDAAVDSPEAGDVAPEGIAFVPAGESPAAIPLLLVANEVSGTTTAFQIHESREADVGRLFAGYFGRAPSPAELDHFDQQLGGGQTDLAGLAEQFAGLQEARNLYGFLDSPTRDADAIASFLDSVYDNVFDRDIGQEGLDFWTGQVQDRLDAGQPVETVIVDIISGARGDDAAAIANKAAAAVSYAKAYATSGKEWTFGDDVIGASDVIAEVDAAAASVSAAETLAAELIAADEVGALGTAEESALTGADLFA